jgi:hypothetical protein
MNKFRKIITLILVPVVGFMMFTVYNGNVRKAGAVGDLAIKHNGVAIAGDPLFTVDNMVPGDEEEEEIEVTNNDLITRMLSVKGEMTSGDQIMAEQLVIQISEGTALPFYSSTLAEFFENADSVLLGAVNSGEDKSFRVRVVFPAESNNDYQGLTVVFNLRFGVILSENIVINEVYYKVDTEKGHENPNERSGNASGRANQGQNDEWIELFNPTGRTISLKNWRLEDNSGRETIINSNTKVKPGEFVLISKSASTWRYWNESISAVKISLGSDIGDGLGNVGDYLILKNPQGEEVDFVAWGNQSVDTIWHALVNPKAETAGSSIERMAPGFDTDSPTDWREVLPPSPGQ